MVGAIGHQLSVDKANPSINTLIGDHDLGVLRILHPDPDFSVPQERQLKLNIVQEIAERYDLDGILIDFARPPLLFSPGRQWEMCHRLTDCVRSVR